MKKIICPVCKEPVAVFEGDTDRFGIRGPIVLAHRALLPTTPRHPVMFDFCLAVGYGPEFAGWLAQDREAGVHLRAHP